MHVGAHLVVEQDERAACTVCIPPNFPRPLPEAVRQRQVMKITVTLHIQCLFCVAIVPDAGGCATRRLVT